MSKEEVKRFLQENEWARKLRNKNRAIALMLENERMTEDTITKILAMDRYFRLCKSEDKELDGDFGDDRVIAEQETEIALGYQSGHNEFIKQVKLL